MKKWNGGERRKNGIYDEEIRTSVALFRQKFDFIEDKILEVSIDIVKIKDIFEKDGFLKYRDFENHNRQDRWMFGVIVTILIGIFIKLVTK